MSKIQDNQRYSPKSGWVLESPFLGTAHVKERDVWVWVWLHGEELFLSKHDTTTAAASAA